MLHTSLEESLGLVADILVVAAVWITSIAMLLPTVRGRNSMLPTGMFLFAICCTLQTETIYNLVDPFLWGGINVTNLVYRVLAVASLAALEIMVLRVVTKRTGTPFEAVVWLIAAAVALLHVVLFVSSSWPGSDTFLSAFNGQMTREAFWVLMPVTGASVSVHVLLTAGRTRLGHKERTVRWGLTLISLSAVAGMAWAGETLLAAMLRLSKADIAPVFFASPDPIAGALCLVMILLSAVGVALGAVSGVWADRLAVRFSVISLWPLWRSHIGAAPEVALGGLRGRLRPFSSQKTQQHVLFRTVVELLELERRYGFKPKNWQRRFISTSSDALSRARATEARRAKVSLIDLWGTR
jgi:hypothetical protein